MHGRCASCNAAFAPSHEHKCSLYSDVKHAFTTCIDAPESPFRQLATALTPVCLRGCTQSCVKAEPWVKSNGLLDRGAALQHAQASDVTRAQDLKLTRLMSSVKGVSFIFELCK